MVARASIFEAKIRVSESFLQFVDPDDKAEQADLSRYKMRVDAFKNAHISKTDADSVFCEQVAQINDGDL